MLADVCFLSKTYAGEFKYTFPLAVLAFLVTKIKFLTENSEKKCLFWIAVLETISPS